MASFTLVCKYYARGACLKGEQCDYSHERKDPPVDICKFYQKGHCAYGSRCRYKHVKAFRVQTSAASSSSSANGIQSVVSDSATARATKGKSTWVPKAKINLSPFNKHARRSSQHKHKDSQGKCADVGESSTAILPTGVKFLYCRKQCFHPTDQKQREKHLKTSCEEKEKHLEALKHSQEIECNVCMERVLLKPKPAECKFGMLPQCDHAFCLSCVSSWRNSSALTSAMDIIYNDTVRTCPMCRKLSSFVIPSDIWYFSKEEKRAIIDSYKANFKPPPPHRANQFDEHYMLDVLGELDLESEEFYSIMKDSEFFNDVDAFQMIAMSEALANGSDDEGMDYFQMADLSEALSDGVDDLGPEDSDDEVFNPTEAAVLSMMMHSRMAEEYSDEDH